MQTALSDKAKKTAAEIIHITGAASHQKIDQAQAVQIMKHHRFLIILNLKMPILWNSAVVL